MNSTIDEQASHQNISSHSQTTPIISKKRNRKLACVECRQQKTKCDLDDQEDGAKKCSRCEKKNKECILQEDFKRTYKRKKSKLLEEKLLDIAQDIMNINNGDINVKEMDDGDKQRLIIQKLFNERDSIMKLLSNTEKNPTIEPSPPVALPQPILVSNHLSENEIRAQKGEPLITSDVLNYDIIAKKAENLGNLLNSISAKTLGNVTLQPDMIKELYLEYVNNYHIFLPIVDITKDPEIIYNISPILFWVINLIAMRRLKRYHEPINEEVSAAAKKKNTNLLINPNSPLKNLSVLVKTIMAEITMQPIIKYYFMDEELNSRDSKYEPILNVSSVYSVQAFLIYSFWPSSSSSLSCDTSWNTIGSAMLQSIRLGLNSAQHSVEYKTNNLQFITDQIKTWVANNALSQYIAGTFGFPSYTSLDYAIWNNCELDLYGDPSKIIVLNKPLKQMLHIMKFQNHCIKTLNSNFLDPLGRISEEEKYPLLLKLQQDLNGLELRMKRTDEIDDIRKFFILAVKISLLSNYFINSNHKKTSSDSSNSDEDETSNTNAQTQEELDVEEQKFTAKFLKDYSVETADIKTKVGLTNLNNTCIELIQHCNKMNHRRPDIIKYLPGVFVLNIWQAASIICKLSFSSLQTNIDLKKCKKTYDIAVKLAQGCSLMKFDLPYRSSRIMKSIWYIFENLYTEWLKKDFQEEFNLNLNIQNRLSASVFFDCLYVLKQHSGLKKKQLLLKKELQQQKQTSEVNLAGKMNLDKNNARKIIATIPLDPEPITAPITQSDRSSPYNSTPETNSLMKSPKGDVNGSKKEILDLKTMLNKTSPSLANNKSTAAIASISRSGSPFPMLLSKNLATLDNTLNPQAKPSFVRDQNLAQKQANVNVLNSILDQHQYQNSPMYSKSPYLVNMNGGKMPMGLNSVLMSPKNIGINSPAGNMLLHSLGPDFAGNSALNTPHPVQKFNEIEVLNELNNMPKNASSNMPSVGAKDDSESVASSSNNMFLENELLWDDVDMLMNEFAFNPTV